MNPHGLGVHFGSICIGQEVLGSVGPNLGQRIKDRAGQCHSEEIVVMASTLRQAHPSIILVLLWV